MDNFSTKKSKWEIDIKTSLIRGLDPSSQPDDINISQDKIDNINDFIVFCINKLILHYQGGDFEQLGDLRMIEIACNSILKNQHIQNNAPNIRIELYPCSVGIRVVINVVKCNKNSKQLISNLIQLEEN